MRYIMDRVKSSLPRLALCGKVLLLVLFVIACVDEYSQYQERRKAEAEVAYRIGMDCFLAHHHDLAAIHIREAAEKGHARAQNRLGMLYSFGLGVKHDYSQALHWYLKAAEQGYSAAQNNIGWMYKDGIGVEQDSQKAAEWFRKAAEQGDEFAHNALNLLAKGEVVR